MKLESPKDKKLRKPNFLDKLLMWEKAAKFFQNSIIWLLQKN